MELLHVMFTQIEVKGEPGTEDARHTHFQYTKQTTNSSPSFSLLFSYTDQDDPIAPVSREASHPLLSFNQTTVEFKKHKR